MKKRFLSIFFTLCLVVALTLSVSAETNKLTYAVGASAPTVSANAEFTITVSITENTGICWLRAFVKYDPAVLTFVSANTDTSDFSAAKVTVNSDPADGECIIVIGTMNAIFDENAATHKSTGTVAKLTFKVNADAKAGTRTAVQVHSGNNDALVKVDGQPVFNFTTNVANTVISVGTSDHSTCTPGAAKRENEKPATCQAAGSYDEVVRCIVCNSIISQKTVTIPQLTDHTGGAPVKEKEIIATCENAGSYDEVVYCTGCKKELSRKHVDVAQSGHVGGEPVKEKEVAATCLKEGSYELVTRCKFCSTEMTRENKKTEKSAHAAGTAVIEDKKDATCTAVGSFNLVTYCKVCNVKMSSVKTEIPAGTHIPADAVVEKEIKPTCTSKGSYESVVYCSVCKSEISRNKLESAKAPHTNSPAVKEKEKKPDCLNVGSYESVVYCSVCKIEVSRKTEIIDKLGHTNGKAVIENRKEPDNCGADGSYDSVIYCTVCKSEVSRVKQAIKAPAHTPGPAATATTPQICTVCNTILVPAIGHTHNWETAWTTDAMGHWYACTNGCSEKKDYAEHQYTDTCDSDCNICGALRQTAGHEYDNGCDATCNKCGQTRDVAGHVYDNDCDTTCNACGTVRTTSHKFDTVCDIDCSICGYTRLEAADHFYGEWKVTVEATDTADGSRERACVMCGSKEIEVIPATGTGTVPPDTTTDGTEPIVPGNDTTAEKGDETTVVVPPEPGCGSAVSAGIVLVAILGCAITFKKKD